MEMGWWLCWYHYRIYYCLLAAGLHGVLIKKTSTAEGLLVDRQVEHDKQNQNLLCYRYTIGQFAISGCKDKEEVLIYNIFK
jgi:hypothetical protein